MARPIRVIDKRNKQYFVVNDLYLNGYAKYLGTIASMVYISLCRHASKEQLAFPSQELIAREINVSKRSVVAKMAELKKWNLIGLERRRNEQGQWKRNDYILLDKSVWKPLPSATIAPSPSANDDITQVQPLHTKDTHIKDTQQQAVEKITKWAYERATPSPSCDESSFRRIVLAGINRLGVEKVEKIFESQTNAIQFLWDLKTL